MPMPYHLYYSGMFNYCFISVNDYMSVFVMVSVSRFGRCSVRNAVAGYGGYYVEAMDSCLFNNVSFLS